MHPQTQSIPFTSFTKTHISLNLSSIANKTEFASRSDTHFSHSLSLSHTHQIHRTHNLSLCLFLSLSNWMYVFLANTHQGTTHMCCFFCCETVTSFKKQKIKSSFFSQSLNFINSKIQIHLQKCTRVAFWDSWKYAYADTSNHFRTKNNCAVGKYWIKEDLFFFNFSPFSCNFYRKVVCTMHQQDTTLYRQSTRWARRLR